MRYIGFLCKDARHHATGRFIELTDLFVRESSFASGGDSAFCLAASAEGTCLAGPQRQPGEVRHKKRDGRIPLQHHCFRHTLEYKRYLMR